MMEKSSAIVLSEAEKRQIKGDIALEKKAGEKDPRVPERFDGWYTHAELEKKL